MYNSVFSTLTTGDWLVHAVKCLLQLIVHLSCVLRERAQLGTSLDKNNVKTRTLHCAFCISIDECSFTK